jgi:predicted nucleic acid-binding protein
MPDEGSRRVVVVNSTPVITLAIVDQLSLLRDLYETVLIPTAVHQEVQAGGPNRAGAPQLAAAPWIKAVSLRDPRRADLLSDLDRGEAEVIALAQERHADLVVIDERLGRRHAKRLGLSLTGTLGVLLKAKREGLLSEIGPIVRAIRDQGVRLGDALVGEVLVIAGEGSRPTE